MSEPGVGIEALSREERLELLEGLCDSLREVDEVRRVVEIRAVGMKDRDQVIIGGEEIDLS